MIRLFVLLAVGAVSVQAEMHSDRPLSQSAKEDSLGRPPPSQNLQIARPEKRGDRKGTPYELVNGHIVFRATVEGRDVWAMLDNLAGASVISPKLTAAVGQTEVTQSGIAFTPLSSRPKYRSGPIDVEVPGQAFFTAPFYVTDLKGPSLSTGRSIDMIIGAEYFSQLGFSVSPHTMTFSFGPGGAVSPPPPYRPVSLESGRPRVQAVLNGIPVTLTVDLGFSGGVGLSSAAWKSITRTAKRGSLKSLDLHGNIANVSTDRADKLQVGDIQVSDVAVCNCPVFPHDGDGILGMEVLGRFPIVIDQKGQKLWIAPVRAGPKPKAD